MAAKRLVLPRPRQRWTVWRKAAVVEAVRLGQLSTEQMKQVYGISPEEFAAWERDLNRSGVRGLRVTRLQRKRNSVGYFLIDRE